MKAKIEQMVAAYNKYATKHGYEDSTVEIDYENRKIIGTFTPKDVNAHSGFSGFFKNAATAGHNESLRADYERIAEALKEL